MQQGAHEDWFHLKGGVMPGTTIGENVFNYSFWQALKKWEEWLPTLNPELTAESVVEVTGGNAVIYLGTAYYVDDITQRNISANLLELLENANNHTKC